jgi:hypothetical protein
MGNGSRLAPALRLSAFTSSVGDMSGESREDLARQILSYFLRNPSAADSFDGIARWRLLEDIARRSIAATEDALAWLIREGYLRQEALPGSKSLFRLNADMRTEAEKFVENSSET